MKLNRVFAANEGIKNLRLKYAQGVHGFDCDGGFVELDKKVIAVAEFVQTSYLVSILYDVVKY